MSIANYGPRAVNPDDLKPEPRSMTAEEFLALPDDGVDRELIQGLLKERGMTVRNRFHARVVLRLGQLLFNWLDARPEPRGAFVGGEAGFRLLRTKESVVGIDVAYVSHAQLAATPSTQKIFDGPPLLAIEILSPSDPHEDVEQKIDLYLNVGTVVWIVDPHFKTVRIHRLGGAIEFFTSADELACEPELPGFRVAVSRIFE